MLNYIDGQPYQSIEFKSQDYVSNTDWNDRHTDREYVNEFSILLEPYLKNISNRLYVNELSIDNMWFQQYSTNSKHQWHIHAKSNWSAIYYVQLPDANVKTLLWDYQQHKILDEIELKEGELFVFPANMIHCSPPNFTNDKKTVIAFNMNGGDVTQIENWNDEYDKKYWTPPN